MKKCSVWDVGGKPETNILGDKPTLSGRVWKPNPHVYSGLSWIRTQVHAQRWKAKKVPLLSRPNPQQSQRSILLKFVSNLLSGQVKVPSGLQMGNGMAESLSTLMNCRQSESPLFGQNPTDMLTKSWVLVFSMPYLKWKSMKLVKGTIS